MLRRKTKHQRLRLITQTTLASTQLRTWRETEEGQQVWQAKQTLPFLEQICHALDNTQATIYGLLIAPQFFIILSTYNRQSFARLSTRYKAAAQAGLCFWWDGTQLRHCEIDHFFVLLQTLPAPRCRVRVKSSSEPVER